MFKNHLRQFESLFAMWPHAYCDGIKHMQVQHSHLCFQVWPTTSYLPRYCLLLEQIKHYLWYWPSQVLLNADLGKVKSYTLQVIKIVPIPSADKDTRMMISTSPWNCVCVSVCCILAASLTVVTRAGVPHWPGVPALQRSHYTSQHQVTTHLPAPGHGAEVNRRGRRHSEESHYSTWFYWTLPIAWDGGL